MHSIGRHTFPSVERLTHSRQPYGGVSQHGQVVAEAAVSLGLWWTDLLWGLAGALASWLGEPQSPSGKTLFQGTCQGCGGIVHQCIQLSFRWKD